MQFAITFRTLTPHKHLCPRCYGDAPCGYDCTLEPDLSEGETLRGSHTPCDRCRWEAANPEAAALERRNNDLARAAANGFPLEAHWKRSPDGHVALTLRCERCRHARVLTALTQPNLMRLLAAEEEAVRGLLGRGCAHLDELLPRYQEARTYWASRPLEAP